METAQHPAEPDEPFGGRTGPKAAGPSSPIRDRVMAAYLPVAGLLERLEGAEPPAGSSGPASAPRLEAVRALLDEQVAGDWADLIRLLVDPAELVRRTGPTGTIATPVLPDDPRALFYEDYRPGVSPAVPEPVPGEPGPDVAEPVPSSPEEVVQAALGTPHVCLVRAADGPERTAALVELVRRLAAAGRRTLLLTPAPQDAAGLLDALRETDQITVVRAESPDDPAEPDPLGELRRLRRELLWLEQWPRDLAALDGLRADGERRRAELAAGEQRLVEAIEAAGRRIEAADQAAEEARRQRERTGEEHARTAEEAERARTAWRDLQEIADAAARDADTRTRAADTAETRHQDLAQQALRCEQELQAARDREATLDDELTRARQALPEATRETEQLATAAADATAAQHASYYRLAAAESALAARRRRLSWGQRLHVAPTPPDVEEARQLVKWRRREAEEAAERARVAVQAHQQAEALRGGLTKFMADAEHELTTLAQTQERLGGQLATLTAERNAAYAEVQRLGREAAEAVDHATQATANARHAGQVAAEAEQRAAVARQAHEEAAVEVERADAEAAEAREHLSALDAELERHRADTVRQNAEFETEVRAFTEAEIRSREHVKEICGTDLDEIPEDLLARHRAESMARADELAAALEAADLFHGTPAGFGRGHYSRGAAFDTLIVLDADRVGDADLLIGAVRSHHWLLVADGRGRPPRLTEDYPEYEHLQDLDPALREAAAERLEHSTFARCLAAAPALCRDLALPDEADPAPTDASAPPAQQPADATRPLPSLPEDIDAPAAEQPAAATRPLTPLPEDVSPEALPLPAGEQPPPADIPPSDETEEAPPAADRTPADARPVPGPDDATQAVTVPADALAEDTNADHPAPANDQADATPTAPLPPTDETEEASSAEAGPPAPGPEDATRPVTVTGASEERTGVGHPTPTDEQAVPRAEDTTSVDDVPLVDEAEETPLPADMTPPAPEADDATRPVTVPGAPEENTGVCRPASSGGRDVSEVGEGACVDDVPLSGGGEALSAAEVEPPASGLDDATRPLAVPNASGEGRSASADGQVAPRVGGAASAGGVPPAGEGEGASSAAADAGDAFGAGDATRPVVVPGAPGEGAGRPASAGE